MPRLSATNRKRIALGLLLIGLTAVASSFIYIAFKDQTASQVIGKEKANIRYVLVNEDEGADFERTNYQLGKDFVTLVNQDEDNQWETASRNLATAGIKSGQYDAMIVIPQDFSDTILSLQSINPEKATIEYLIRDGQGQVTNQVIEKKVNDMLHDFNTRVVQMYFSSIVGSLSEAQQNVTNMVETETDQHNYLISNIQSPFQGLPQSFESAVSSANLLKSGSDTVEAEQKSFVTSVHALMNGNAEELGNLATSLSSSDDDTVGPSLPSHSNGATAPLEDFNQPWLNQFGLLGADNLNTNPKDDTAASPTLYERFLLNAKAYENSQTQIKTALETNITTLENQLTNLQSLRQSIATKYYGDSHLTPQTATVEQAKEAIARLMEPDKNSNLDSAYLTAINNSVGAVPVSNLSNLVDLLASNGVITEEEAGKYRSDLAIVNRYARDFKASTGTTAAYDFLNSTDGNTANPVSTVATFNIATAGDTISLSGNGVALTNGASVASQIQTSLDQQLTAYNKSATVRQEGNRFTVTIDDTTQSATSGDSNSGQTGQGTDTTDKAQLSLPDSLPVTVSVSLAWTPNSVADQSYQETSYDWSNNKGSMISGKLAAFNSKNDTLVQDLPLILKNFAALEQAAQQVTTIFAEPYDTVGTFASRLSADDTPLSELASQNSVYRLYNNMELKERANAISDEFGKSYKANGDELYNEVASQIETLQRTLGSKDSSDSDGTLYGQLNTLPEPSAYYQLISELGEWYQSTKDVLDDYYQSETLALTEADSAKTKQAETLARQLKTIQASVKDMVSSTESTANDLPSTKGFLEDFTAKTDHIQSETQTLLADLNQSVEEEAANLSENQDYAKAFGRVLANTKNGGADNTKVFNFLASPIEVSSIQASQAKTSVIPYYMTIVGALIVSAVSFFTVKLMGPRHPDDQNTLTPPTRVWSNLPNLLKIVGLSFMTALGFSSVTVSLVQAIPKPMWFVYTFLFIFSFTTLFVYCLRQLKQTAAFYLFTFLVGIYLLLMPIIGVATKPGTLLATVYRLSPLQNIENGYTAMVNGVAVGPVTLVILLTLSIVAICLNLFIKQPSVKSDEKAI